MKPTYTFSELFRRKDLPHFRGILLKVSQQANKDQAEIIRKYHKKLDNLAKKQHTL